MMVFDWKHFLPRTVLSRGTGSTGDAVDGQFVFVKESDVYISVVINYFI